MLVTPQNSLTQFAAFPAWPTLLCSTFTQQQHALHLVGSELLGILYLPWPKAVSYAQTLGKSMLYRLQLTPLRPSYIAYR